MKTAEMVKKELQICINRLNIYTEKNATNLIEAIDNLYEIQLLNYIQPTDGAYIDINYIPTNNTGIKIVVSFSDVTNDRVLIGTRADSGNTRYFIGVYNNLLYFGWNEPMPSVNLRPQITTNTKYVASMNYLNNKKCKLNNIEYAEINQNIAIQNYPISLFRFNSAGTISTNTNISKVYNFQITENQNIIRDFVPVLDKNNTPCFFERIQNKFYYNQGSGTFEYESIN